MPPRKSKAGRKRRIARGPARRQSRIQARGHAKVPVRRADALVEDPRIEAGILEMNRGRSLTAAARALHLSRPRFLKFLVEHRLVKRKRQRWVINDKRPRRVQVMTAGRPRNLLLVGYQQACLVAYHHSAVAEFVRSNNLRHLRPFKGLTVQAVTGRRYVLETDPNALHRIAAMDSPPFHEIYEITSNT